MNISKYAIPMAVGAVFTLGSCADDLQKNIVVDKPQSVVEDEQYRDLSALKSYVSNENFKLSGSVSADDFLSGGNSAAIAVNNFTELASESAMSYGGVVKDDGTMDFSKVKSLITSAGKYGLSVYGGPLVSNDLQNPKHLKALFEGRAKEIEEQNKNNAPAEPVEIVPFVTNGSFNEDNTDGWSNNWQGPTYSRISENGSACIEYTIGDAGENQWDKQAIYTLPVAMEAEKEYIVKMKVKATEPPADPTAESSKVLGLWPIWDASENKNQWGGSDDVQYCESFAVTSDWQELEWKFKASFPHDKLQFVFGKLSGKIYFDDLSVALAEGGSEMAVNGSFDAESIEGWANNWQGPTYARVEDKNFFIQYECGDAGQNPWDKQAIYTLGSPLVKSGKYVITMKVKPENAGSIAMWPIWAASENKDQWGGSADVQYCDTYELEAGKWNDLKWEITANFPHDKLQFVFGTQSGKIAFDDLVVDGPTASAEPTPAPSAGGSVWTNVIPNSDLEGDDMSAFFVKVSPATKPVAGTVVAGEGVDGSKCLKIVCPAKVSEAWDSQLWIATPESYPEGTKIKVVFDYKADKDATVSTQAHGAPDGDHYHDWQFAGDVTLSTGWQHFEKEITLTSGQAGSDGFRSCTFNLAVDKDVTYYFDNCEIWIESALPAGEISADEKKVIVKNALADWLKGAMEAVEGKITCWDVIANPVSNSVKSDAGDFYALQHEKTPNADQKLAGQTFYWQDYIDEVEFGKMAVDTTRKYFAGDKGALKLFVSEYGLEDPKKLESLLHWIDLWEDEDTKIDGISVQLYLDADDLTSEAAKVDALFTSLASTGRLIRIGAINISGVDDADIAALYKSVVQSYLSKVAKDKQYGINISTLATSDFGGLWTEEYKRNASYRSFAEGLSN